MMVKQLILRLKTTESKLARSKCISFFMGLPEDPKKKKKKINPIESPLFHFSDESCCRFLLLDLY